MRSSQRYLTIHDKKYFWLLTRPSQNNHSIKFVIMFLILWKKNNYKFINFMFV